jgi:hypothetical protein
MTPTEMAALARERLAHVVLPDERGRLEIVTVYVPEEGPADNVRNAMQVIACIEALHPATYIMVPELCRAQRRCHAAVVLMEHGGSRACVVLHVRRAIESLLEANLDWDVMPEVRGAVARLMRAWFQLQPRSDS